MKIVDEVHGFRYHDNRDLLGFVDGTENPEGHEAVEAALVDAERDPEFVGGSYVIVQKYTHDTAAWRTLSDPSRRWSSAAPRPTTSSCRTR